MLITTFFRHQRAPGNGLALFDQRLTGQVGYAHLLGGKDHHFPVFEENHLAGVGQHGRDIGSHKIFPLSLADNQRRTEFGGNQLVRLGSTDNGDRVGAFDFPEGQTYGPFKITAQAEMFLNQMGNDLGIGFRVEMMPRLLQPLFQLQVVLDDAVMHHHDVTRFVRVGIDFRRTPVGRPAGVPDPPAALGRLLAEDILQIDQFSLGSPDLQLTAVEGADPRRIIAAIFETPQTIDDNG